MGIRVSVRATEHIDEQLCFLEPAIYILPDYKDKVCERLFS